MKHRYWPTGQHDQAVRLLMKQTRQSIERGELTDEPTALGGELLDNGQWSVVGSHREARAATLLYLKSHDDLFLGTSRAPDCYSARRSDFSASLNKPEIKSHARGIMYRSSHRVAEMDARRRLFRGKIILRLSD